MNASQITDALNALCYEDRLDYYTGKVAFGDVSVKLVLYTDDDDDLAPALRRARAVLAGFATYEHRAQAYAVTQLLPLKNAVWLDEDEETPLTPEQFKQRMTLEALVFYAEGDVTFYYQDGDLFWGHTIELVMDAVNNFTRAVIAG